MTGTTDKATYAPGETVSVTTSGGYRPSAARAILYDQNGALLDMSTGTGTIPVNAPQWPVTLSGTAPTTPGTYTWSVAWYGNQFDAGGATFGNGSNGSQWTPDPGNANHGEERVATNSFTVTGADTTPPTVASTVPDNNALNVAVNTLVTATFSEAIDNTTVDNTSFFVTDGVDNVVGTISFSPDNTMATFTSSALLAAATVYTATLTTAVTDLAGNPLAAGYTWSFTTGSGPDTTPPTVHGTTPDNNATGVAVTTAVSVVFDEAIDGTTVDGTSFFVTDGVDNVVGTLNVVGSTATFTPSSALTDNTAYAATVTTAVTDLAGNPLASDYTWVFTTGVTPPPSGGSSGGGCSVTAGGSRWEDGVAIALLGLLAMWIGLRFRNRKERR